MIVEGAKVKISQLVGKGREKIKVFVSSHHASREPLLRQKLTKEFLELDMNSRGIDVKSLDLQSFCRIKNISTKDPIEKINRITAKLCQEHPDHDIIFTVDEMEPVEKIAIKDTQFYYQLLVNKGTRDWSRLEARKNLIWLIALQPMGWWNWGARWNCVKIPEDSKNVLSRQLIYRYRMSDAIK